MTMPTIMIKSGPTIVMMNDDDHDENDYGDGND